MDQKASERIAERMKILGEKYAKQFPERIAEINSLWARISADTVDREALDSLYRLVHGLAGSGATFGFPQLSEAAKECEIMLLEGIESGQLAYDAVRSRVETVVATLEC